MPEYVPVEGRLRAVVPVRVKSSHAEISIQGFKLWVPCARLDKVVHRRRVILFPRGNHAQVVIAIGDSWPELGRKPLHLFRLAGRNIDLGDCATGVAVFHWRRIRQSAHSVALGMGLVPQLRGDLQFLPAFLLTAGLQEYSSKGEYSCKPAVRRKAGRNCRSPRSCGTSPIPSATEWADCRIRRQWKTATPVAQSPRSMFLPASRKRWSGLRPSSGQLSPMAITTWA